MRGAPQYQCFGAISMLGAAIFVSKRLQRVAFAFLCLFAVQLVLGLASCEPDEPALSGAVRVPIIQASR